MLKQFCFIWLREGLESFSLGPKAFEPAAFVKTFGYEVKHHSDAEPLRRGRSAGNDPEK